MPRDRKKDWFQGKSYEVEKRRSYRQQTNDTFYGQPIHKTRAKESFLVSFLKVWHKYKISPSEIWLRHVARHLGLRFTDDDPLDDYGNWTKNMAQVELFKNIIQLPDNVHLAVKENFNHDSISLEIIVPVKHFMNEEGKNKIVEALHNVAMYIQSLE